MKTTSNMKLFFAFFICVLFSPFIRAQTEEDKTVTLTVTGTGSSSDEAKEKALRNAIEQAFGAFISSRTEILNDELVSDQITSISSGNIEKYEIISEVKLPNGENAVTLRTIVSVSKLTKYFINKGISAEFDGALFAFNINQQILNEKSEIKAVEGLCEVLKQLSDVSFDYSIKTSNPVSLNGDNENWRIPICISVSANKNLLSAANYMFETLKGVSLSREEALSILKLGKEVYPVSFSVSKKKEDYFILRSNESISKLLSQLYYFNHSIQNFKISNGFSQWEISDYPDGTDGKQKNIKIEDGHFRIFYFGDKARCVFHPGGYLNTYHDITYGDKTVLECCDPQKFILDYTQIHISSETRTVICRPERDCTHSIRPYDKYDNNEPFWFVFNLNGFGKKCQIINENAGLIISFNNVITNDSKDYKEWRDVLVKFYIEDLKKLEEIKKISEYRVSPIVKSNE